MDINNANDKYVEIISAKIPLIDFKLRETFHYRGLIYMFVCRDFVTQYKQTILGPLWYIIQPLITAIIFTLIFTKVAAISTDGVPPVVFYLGGLTLWNYFSSALSSTSSMFIDNQGIFGKIYFPRMVVPISSVISNLIKFAIQFILFLVFYLYYYFGNASTLHLNRFILLVPLLILITMGLSLGFGVLFSSFTTKYRDLKFLLGFAVQLWMYATPIIYPLSSLSQNYQWVLALNPMTGVITAFKYAFFSTDIVKWQYLIYSFVFMVVLILVSTLIFNRIEKNFIDTI